MAKHKHDSFLDDSLNGTTMPAGANRLTGTLYSSTAITNKNIYGFSINYSGGDQPHNNIPPNISKNIWRKIA